jgi:mannose-6-phosphate isomerase
MHAKLDYPLQFEPILVERPWGGRCLESILGKRLPSSGRYGESWEISDQASQSTRVANGPYRGSTLRELVASHPESIADPTAQPRTNARDAEHRFPLLIKWLDAQENLSIQVHPPDGHPRLPPHELGKTECWFIVHAQPGALIYLGLRPGIDRQTLTRELASNRVVQCLNSFPARPGDFYFVPAGTVHAIGAGVLLAEIQQSSDTTFRLFDWNRVDSSTQKPRALHVDAALDSIDFGRDSSFHVHVPTTADPLNAHSDLLEADRCPYFAVAYRRLESAVPVGESDRFHILMCLSGTGRIEGGALQTALQRGDCVLLPRGNFFKCCPLPQLEVLDTWVPNRP